MRIFSLLLKVKIIILNRKNPLMLKELGLDGCQKEETIEIEDKVA
tara:strand:+ start:159 stop:293 length:135 start_codon:yes stop_codon:yes gene_type:complete